MKYFIFYLFLAWGSTLAAQNTLLDTSVVMDKLDGKVEIPIVLNVKADQLEIMLEGLVVDGSVEVSMVSPEGERQGGFQLNTLSGDYTISHTTTKTKPSGQSTRSVIRSSGGNSTVETTTVVEKEEKSSKKKKKSKSRTSTSSYDSNDSANNNNQSVQVTGSSTSLSMSSSGDQSVAVNATTGEEREAKGVMMNTIKKPEQGTWKIVLEAENVTGTLQIRVEQD